MGDNSPAGKTLKRIADTLDHIKETLESDWPCGVFEAPWTCLTVHPSQLPDHSPCHWCANLSAPGAPDPVLSSG